MTYKGKIGLCDISCNNKKVTLCNKSWVWVKFGVCLCNFDATANFENCHERMAMNFHWKFFQVQARCLLQILNGFLISFTLGGSACFRI